MKKLIAMILLVGCFTVAGVAEARVGGGRSFGSRGARSFSVPPSVYRNSPSRSYGTQPMGGMNSYQNPYRNEGPRPSTLGSAMGSSFMRSMAAGMAGSFLGNMLFRSFGGGGYGYSEVGSGRGGFGLIEILLLGGVLYFLFKLLMSRSQTFAASGVGQASATDRAASLLRQARSENWNQGAATSNDYGSQSSANAIETAPMNTEIAMDIFFKVQGAWGNRDLSSVRELLDVEARIFLDDEINRLKSAKKINCLQNIAVRGTDVIEAWQEGSRDYSTVRFTANLLDFTIDEQTQQVVEGSKTNPVKFEELWTFSKDADSSHWRLSAIQQT